MERIFTEEEFYKTYKSKIEIYSDALYYDSTSRGHDLYREYYSAAHTLQRYLVEKHIGEGFTEVMAYNMYDFITGGDLKPPRGYEYINANRYPELARMHNEAEKAREKYNIFTWNSVVNYINRCYTVKKLLEWNLVVSEHLQAAKEFAAMHDRLKEIKEKEYWGYAENTRKYDDEQTRRKQQYEEDFAAAHPGYKRDLRNADPGAHYSFERGKKIQEVKDKYGFKDFEDEEHAVRRCAKIYYNIIEDRERKIYEKQKSLGNLNNYSRAVIRAIKDNYPKFTDEECVNYWKRHFNISLALHTEQKVQTVSTPSAKPAAPKKAEKTLEQKPVAKPKRVADPKPSIPTPEEIKKCCRIGSNGKLYEYFGEAEHVTLPSDITEISKTAFDNVKKQLRVVVLPEGVAWVHENTFADCPSLEEVVLPKTLTGMGEMAFANCPKLKSVSFSTGILNIAKFAFEGCISLKSVVLPNDCLIFNSSFPNTCEVKFSGEENTSLPKSTATPTATDVTLFKIENKICIKYLGSDEQVVIPDGVTKISSTAFIKARKFLKSVTISEGVTEIERNTFAACEKLQNVTLPASLRIIDNLSFDHCTALTDIYIPEGVTKIGTFAFSNCLKLKTVHIPSTIKEIGLLAFSRCDKLAEVVLPKAFEQTNLLSIFPQSCKVTFADK